MVTDKHNDPLIQKTRGRRKSGADASTTFNVYLERGKVGELMIKDFMSNKIACNKDGFIFKEKDSVGVISQCYGIISLAEYLKFDLDLKDYSEVSERLSLTFNSLMDMIRANDPNGPVFEPTPYAVGTKIDTYIETVTLVLKVLIEVRKLLGIDLMEMRDTVKVDPKFLTDLANDSEVTQSEMRFIEKLIVKCFSVLSRSALRTISGDGEDYYLSNSTEPLLDAFGRNMKYRGWTYTEVPRDNQEKCEPSLYFTYLVGEAYLTFYEAFEESIGLIRRLTRAVQKKNDWYLAPMYRQAWEEQLKKRAQDKGIEYVRPEYKNISDYRDLDNAVSSADWHELIEYEPDLEVIGRASEQILRDFEFLKKNYSAYRRFQKAMMDAGRYVDTKFSKIDTTKDFFSYNFTLTTAKNIEESSSSDAMFNVLFAINIMMASGIDADYADNDKDEEFYESLRYTVPNIQKLYRKFLREGRESICDQYILKFNESLPVDDNPESAFNKVKLLRKQRILVYNLTPVLIKTYSTLSKYLTPYPQYEMQNYEKEIINNRFKDSWLWDREAFNLITNYNYVYVLRMFYDYYETFEKAFALAEDTYIRTTKAELEAEKREHKQLRDAITEKKNQELEELQKQMDALKKAHAGDLAAKDQEISALKSSRTPVEEEIGKLVEFYFADIFKNQLENMIMANGHPMNEGDDVNTAFKRLLLSYFFKLRDDFMTYDITKREGVEKVEAFNDFESQLFDRLSNAIKSDKI